MPKENTFETPPSVGIEDVRKLNRLRKEVLLQQQVIQNWIDAQIPEELLTASNAVMCAGNLARTGGAGFMISKDIVTYLGGHEATRALLAQLKEQLQPMVTTDIIEDSTFKDFQVQLSLKQ
ncbi:MAG: hypothetical protein WAV15_01105 [Minisyncoccia bacterium]